MNKRLLTALCITVTTIASGASSDQAQPKMTIPRKMSLTAQAAWQVLKKELEAGNTQILNEQDTLLAYFHNRNVHIQFTAENLSEIARAYYLYHKSIDSMPTWLQEYFQGVSIQDLLDFDMIPEQKCFEKSLFLDGYYINDLTGLAHIPGIEHKLLLYLDKNKLTHIAEEAFVGLEHIICLSITHNILTTVPQAALSHLPNLKNLYLRGNPIQVIKKESFTTLTALKCLSLQHIKNITIEPGAFKYLTSLESLWLLNNNLPEETKARIRREIPTVDIRF